MHQNQNKNQNNEQKHIAVLQAEVLQYLNPQEGESYLDLTAGYGGHASLILSRTKRPEKAVLVDRDQAAVHALDIQFARQGTTVLQRDFLTASRELVRSGQAFDVILADLGVSSPHLNEASRGFTLLAEGPLDMRMDQTQALTAETIVNTFSETAIADILTRYGEEPKAQHIARLIVANRPFATTKELADVVARAWPGHSRLHPATRTFQALRIAVNDELGQLEQSLPLWLQLMAPGGRIAVISFHSLEDRLVKRTFAEADGNRYDATIRVLTKRPVTATAKEIVSNPRARSAKLRAAVKK